LGLLFLVNDSRRLNNIGYAIKLAKNEAVPVEKITDTKSTLMEFAQNDNLLASGPLVVSSKNPRYFEDSTGSAVLLTGSHFWLNLQDGVLTDPPPEFDYVGYLDFLSAYNHNFFRLWAWEQAKWVVESSDDYYFSPMPYMRTGPGVALDGKPKFDLDQFNQAYFDRLRDRVFLASERGMYVSIMLFNGWSIEDAKGSYSQANPWLGHPYNANNNVNDVDGDPNGDNSGSELHTLGDLEITAYQEAYIRKVIDSLNDLDNVLYEISNESHEDSQDWQYHMIEFIKDYESSLPKQHPVGMTVEWPNGNNAELFASSADWISMNGNINNPPVADGSKVIIADTDHLCGICGNRSWVWKSFTRGENPIFMDQYDDSYYLSGGGYDPNNLNDVSLRKNLGYVREFAGRVNLLAMIPSGDLCSTEYCLANLSQEGAEFIVYSPDSGNVSVDLTSLDGQLSFEWFNPDTGEAAGLGSTQGGSIRVFEPPYIGDSVLYIYDPDVVTPTQPPDEDSKIFLPFIGNKIVGSPLIPDPLTDFSFTETFEGDPSLPTPYISENWDISVHSRDLDTWMQLEGMQADHGDDCSPPPATHLVTDYEDAVYQCHNHVMTAINARGYGVIYLTPNQMIDFSDGEAVLRFDISTFRKAVRDWVDIWITPYDDHLILPLEEALPDLQGEPRRGIHVSLSLSMPGGKLTARRIENFVAEDISSVSWSSYADFIEPSATRRDTFEIRISKNHLKAGMPDYDFWWIDTDITELDWSTGIVQLGHHSYNPQKTCPEQNCQPNTWHWDNITISNVLPFEMIKTQQRFANPEQDTLVLDKPALENAKLRFSGIGKNLEVSWDGGRTWVQAERQDQEFDIEGHFSSYWMSIPENIRSITFRGQEWWGGDWHVRDVSVWVSPGK
jgi:hypothetical protein